VAECISRYGSRCWNNHHIEVHPVDVVLDVPNYVGMSVAAVMATPEYDNLNVVFILGTPDAVPNIVYEQSITAFSTVAYGSELTLYITSQE